MPQLYDSLLTNKLFGLSVPDLNAIRNKLNVMGLDTKDLLTFLDRDKVQLFAEQQREIIFLKRRIAEITQVVNNQ